MRTRHPCHPLTHQELGLPVNADIPLLGFIGRLDYQKGVDLIRDNYDWLMSGGCRCGVVGVWLWLKFCGWLGACWGPGLAHAPGTCTHAHEACMRPPLLTRPPPRAVPAPAAEGCQVVLLGSGREDLENDLR